MIITIARQCGCGAIDIGKMLSADYGVPFYTRKSLKDMASECGVLEELDDFFEERPVDELLFAISAFGADEGPLHSKALDVLSEMIGRRDCIIIGRCGNYIFRQRKDLVSVFLKGREADRVAVVAAERHISAEEAARDRDLRENFDACCARAVARLNTLSEYCVPLVKTGGRFIAYKGKADEEIAEAKHAFCVLGLRLIDAQKAELPCGEGERTIVVAEKIAKTPAAYPRGRGKERSKPL